jgi:predicted transcriptional regulator
MTINKELQELIDMGFVEIQMHNFRLYCNLTDKGNQLICDDNEEQLTQQEEINLQLFLDTMWKDDE